jgi:hypothetical protein
MLARLFLFAVTLDPVKLNVCVLLICGVAYGGIDADRYRAGIARLNVMDPHSACVARDALRKTIRKARPADRAAMVEEFEEFVKAVAFHTHGTYVETENSDMRRALAVACLRICTALERRVCERGVRHK